MQPLTESPLAEGNILSHIKPKAVTCVTSSAATVYMQTERPLEGSVLLPKAIY